jgi:quercetin dioxygenase-like cupin family protein
MIYVVEGAGVLKVGDGTEEFAAGSLAHYRGDEELSVTNDGDTGLTLLAFLAPPFPPPPEPQSG